jgi:serine/threonine-protein kinase
VPDVVGKTKQVADDLMRAKGLIAKFTQEESETVAADSVIRQTPKAGEKLAPDSEVTVVISAGKGQAQIPNLLGHPEASAANALGILGFKTTIQRRAAANIGPGDVIETVPAAGTIAEKGSTITIVISTGVATTTTVPTTTTTKKP